MAATGRVRPPMRPRAVLGDEPRRPSGSLEPGRPCDLAGLPSIPDLTLADDPNVYPCVESRYASTLFVAEEGMR
jgi:hypothetical protein